MNSRRTTKPAPWDLEYEGTAAAASATRRGRVALEDRFDTNVFTSSGPGIENISFEFVPRRSSLQRRALWKLGQGHSCAPQRQSAPSALRLEGERGGAPDEKLPVERIRDDGRTE
jgi:hypothetical protein